jgi:two-component system chemotaxis response regulator CheB
VFILESEAEVRVIGTAEDGAQALAFLEREHPDVITMDIHMPRLDGFETTCRIMETGPVPIVMVSASLQPGETQLAFRAIQAGALDAVEKPRGPGHADHQAMADSPAARRQSHG